MARTNPEIARTARIVSVVCGSLFCLFCFFYLWKVQGVVLGMAQHVLSEGLTTYNPLIGACIFTVVLQILQHLVNSVAKLQREWTCLSYFPSFFTLALFTSADATAYRGFHLDYWLWLYPLGLVLFIVVTVLSKRFTRTYSTREGGIFLRMTLPNLVLFLLQAALTVALGNTDEKIHNQLAIEYNLSQGRLDEALEVGKLSKATTVEITALRNLALYQKGELAERLFTYPQKFGAEGLLLDRADTARMIYSPAEFYKQLGAYKHHEGQPAREYLWMLNLSPRAQQPMAEQYQLCAYLLDRDLESFGERIGQVYQLNDSVCEELPRSYAEALVLYLRTHPGKYPYHNEVQETNYQDYQNMVSSVDNSILSQNKTIRDFGTTFWYYYDHR